MSPGGCRRHSSVFSRRNKGGGPCNDSSLGLESARKAGNHAGKAWALNQLGFALARLRDSEAFGCLEQALTIRRELGDVTGEVPTVIGLAEGYLKVHGLGLDTCGTCGSP